MHLPRITTQILLQTFSCSRPYRDNIKSRAAFSVDTQNKIPYTFDPLKGVLYISLWIGMEKDERLNSWNEVWIFPQCAELKLAWTIFSGETIIYQGGR
jgi:hypothetical protein